MVRLVFLLAVAAFAAGCGSSSKSAAPSAPAAPGPGEVLYRGTAWAVVVDHGKAVAQHLVGGAWKTDASGAVRVSVLGPKPGSTGNAATPQVAATLSAKSDLAESALWVDGVELLEKGGGLTPMRGTIYGAPAAPLKPGRHTAVAFARTAAHATAVAWTFST
ncbi:MAG: hypothetical protein ACXVQQ_00660 [Gaiellaceae bacterium]